jgi:hypothetical protein
MDHDQEAAYVLSQEPAFALGYVVGLMDDLVNDTRQDRKWIRERARAIVNEWCRRHPDAPTARKHAAKAGAR